MSTSTIASAAFNALVQSEVGGANSIQAYKVIEPQPGKSSNGNSGYSLGFLQEDFTQGRNAFNLLDAALGTIRLTYHAA